MTEEVSEFDPYRISATNNPPDPLLVDETKRLKEVVVIVREDEDEEDDTDSGPIGGSGGEALGSIAAPITTRIKKEATGLANRAVILLFAGAAFLVILFALLLARGSGGDSLVYCRDLPEWNQTADCL